MPSNRNRRTRLRSSMFRSSRPLTAMTASTSPKSLDIYMYLSLVSWSSYYTHSILDCHSLRFSDAFYTSSITRAFYCSYTNALFFSSSIMRISSCIRYFTHLRSSNNDFTFIFSSSLLWLISISFLFRYSCFSSMVLTL